MDNNITVTRASLPPFEEYIEIIKPLWESRWITNMGTYHEQLEQELKHYLEVPQLSLMVNGHMALELAIQAFDFPAGGEVITTPFTFISTTHAIIRNGLLPVFCDIKLTDYTIDETKIEELITEKTVAILPVHVYGNICNYQKIEEIADRYNLKVIYDAAHAFGQKINNISVGNLGDMSIFSFHATKVFNTIEGGGITFRDPVWYKKLYNLKNFGIRSEEIVAEVGANAKMNEFCAAMGLCNLKHVESDIEERRKRVAYYLKAMEGIRGIKYSSYDNRDTEYSYGYFPVLFQPEVLGKGKRDLVYNRLREKNIYSRKYFYPITSDEACFKNKYSKIPLENARYAGDNILVLPLYPELSFEDIEEIAFVVKSCCKE